MTDKLLPCPFCGGEAYHYAPGPIEHHIACINYKACGADITRDSEAEAIAAWNTRAERTCECIAEYAKSPIDGKTIVLHRCSACHELMRPYMHYCPDCGARVVGQTAEEHMPFYTNDEIVEEMRAINDEWVKERTCRVDGSISWDWTGASTTYEHNLTCGHMVTTDDPEPPNYCPECGARVVS